MNTSTRRLNFLKPLLRAYFRGIEGNRKLRGLLGEDRPLWRDISVYQGNWNAVISQSNGVVGVFARAGYGLVTDGSFTINYLKAQGIGMYCSSYWAIYPNQPMITQLDLWYRQHDEIDFIPRVLDVEVSAGMSSGFIGEYILKCADVINMRDGIDPIIYSRANLINPWFANWTSAELNRFWYWLAQYLLSGAEHSGPPTLPNRLLRERVILHQTSDHKIDFPGEADSLSIDWNRWERGNLFEMRQFIKDNFGYSASPPLTVQEQLDDHERRIRLLEAQA